MQIVLKVNSEAIRRRIKEAGLDLCACCSFDQAVWLHLSTTLCEQNITKIHGVGYGSEENDKVETILKQFEIESSDYVDCGYDVDKFIRVCKSIIK